jgi:hypothetical protein
VLAGLGYLLLAMAVSWPLASHLDTWVLGYPTIDSLDTILLRGLVSDLLFENPGDLPTTQGVYFPIGYPILHLVPNLMDHLIGGGLSRVLGFPRGDNVFWLLLIAGNGLAAHRLGLQLGKTHSAAMLVGVAYAVSENFLREINLHHAPQALSPWAPLYLAAILRATQAEGSRRDALAAGVWMGLSGITYWYTAIFLAVGSLPILFTRRSAWRRFAQAAGIALCVASPFLLPYAFHLGDLPLANLSQIPDPSQTSAALQALPAGQAFLTEHGNDLALPFRSTPLDTTNRISWVLMIAVVLSLKKGGSKVLLWIAGVGAVLALGPTLRWGSDPVLLGDHPIWLPFAWLAKASPLFERMTWPERWGILIALGMAAAAAKAPRPRLFTGLILIETLIFSGNAPLQHTDLSPHSGWERLQLTRGAVLELPLARGHQHAPFVGLHARIHGKAVVNPILLPPESQAPPAWRAWIEQQGLSTQFQAIAKGEMPTPNQQSKKSLLAAGVGAIALDAGPGAGLSPARILRWKKGLTALFGPAEDQGGVLIWWLHDAPTIAADPLLFRGFAIETGAQWRKAMREESKRNPPPEIDTLIQPLWGR